MLMYYIYILHISIFCKSICIHWPSIYSQPGLASHLFDRKMNKITPSTSSEFKRKIMENHPIPSSEEMNSAWTKLWILATTVSLQKPGDSKRHLGAINIHQKNDKYIYIYWVSHWKNNMWTYPKTSWWPKKHYQQAPPLTIAQIR